MRRRRRRRRLRPTADTTTTGGDTATTTGEADIAALDANGDGEVRIGIAAAGPRDDGAYYQAVVDAAETFSEENGFGEVIVVDNIQAADAATELENLAQQPIDIMVVGASEIAEPMPDLAEEVLRHLLVLQLRRRLPRGAGLPAEHRQRRRHRLHRRGGDRHRCCATPTATRSR